MNKHIEKLYNSAKKSSRLVIGLMSGTSLDGLDVALCKIEGQGSDTKVEVLEFTTVEYTQNYKSKIKSVFAKRQVDLQQVTLLHPWVGVLHGQMVNQCLADWGVIASEIDAIASHGQTIYHCPLRQHGQIEFGNATLQIGDADHLAVTTGITTLGDFRQKHIAAGGEGAPLAVYGDYLFFTSRQENRILLNMGGIANLTYLPKTADSSAVFSSDTGPGNTIMDAFVQLHFAPLQYDKDSAIARQGKVHTGLLSALLEHDFFALNFPKTTGPEVFNLGYLAAAQQRSSTQELGLEDALATLNVFSATTIANALNNAAAELGEFNVYASGGGIHNPLLMEHILNLCPRVSEVRDTSQLGIHPDAKEAVLFAILANECLVGGQQAFGNIEQGIPNVTMGKISFAD